MKLYDTIRLFNVLLQNLLPDENNFKFIVIANPHNNKRFCFIFCNNNEAYSDADTYDVGV